MSGAEKLAGPPFLRARTLINVDSEEECVARSYPPTCAQGTLRALNIADRRAICIGCAGGFEAALELPVRREPLPREYVVASLTVTGLRGGHTGIDIARVRGNAIQVLAGVLQAWLRAETRAASAPTAANAFVEGGEAGLRLDALTCDSALNTIPRTCTSRLAVPRARLPAFREACRAAQQALRQDWAPAEDPAAIELQLVLEEEQKQEQEQEQARRSEQRPDFLDAYSTRRLLDLVSSAPHGPLRMTPHAPDEVQTSIAFSRICVRADRAELEFFARSSSARQLQEVYWRLGALARLAGGCLSEARNEFPSWQPDPSSPLLAVLRRVSEAAYRAAPRVYSVHAGLECGFLVAKYPECVPDPVLSCAPSIDLRFFEPDLLAGWTARR
jgi:dipeptidase D